MGRKIAEVEARRKASKVSDEKRTWGQKEEGEALFNL